MNVAARATPNQAAKTVVQAVQRAKVEQVQASIEGNPFFKLMFVEKLDDQQKIDTFKKEMLAAQTRLDRVEKAKQFAQFRTFLSTTAQELDVKLMKAQDTKGLGRMQQVIKNMNDRLIDVQDSLKEMNDIVGAVFKLREQGSLFEVFKRIRANKVREGDIDKARQELETRVGSITDDMTHLVQKMDEERQNVGWLTGKIKPAAQARIDAYQRQIQTLEGDLDKAKAHIQALNDERASLKATGEYADAEDKFRRMLDLSTEEHNARQQNAVDSAIAFTETSKEEVGELRTHFDTSVANLEKLVDNTNRMTSVYGTLTDGLEQTIKAAKEDREKLAIGPEGETLAQRAERENKKVDIEEYIKQLTESQVLTHKGYGELGIKGMNARSMRESNSRALTNVEELYSQGIAGATSGLVVTLQAIGNAAISETTAAAHQTLADLDKITSETAKSEWINLNEDTAGIRQNLEAMVDKMASYNQVFQQGTDIARNNMETITTILSDIKAKTEETIRLGREHGAISAEVGDAKPAAPTGAAPASSNPFA